MVFLFSPCWCWLVLGLVVVLAGLLTRPFLGLGLLLTLLCLLRVGRGRLLLSSPSWEAKLTFLFSCITHSLLHSD